MDRLISVSEVRRIFRHIIGLKVSDVDLGHGSFLTMSFNAVDSLQNDGYFLWIYCTGWTLCDQTSILLANEDPRDYIASNIKIIENSIVSQLNVDFPEMSMRLFLSNKFQLATFPAFSKNYEHWMWRLPSGEWLKAGPGSAFSVIDNYHCLDYHI
jgi:hypothetical protein